MTCWIMQGWCQCIYLTWSWKKSKKSKSTVYAEFLQGNWVVNKNPLPFRAIGADHALEHINRAMKVSGGLVGITLNPSARTKFILIAPELARLAREPKEMAGYTPSSRMNHHTLSPHSWVKTGQKCYFSVSHHHELLKSICWKSTLLYNLVTKAIMLDKVKSGLCGQRNIRTHLFKEWAH